MPPGSRWLHRPVPVMTLVRLTVDKGHQRKGRGQALLEDLKTLRIRGRESPRIDVFDPRKRLS